MQTKTIQVQRGIATNHNETLVRDVVQRRQVKLEAVQARRGIATNHNETLVRDRTA